MGHILYDYVVENKTETIKMVIGAIVTTTLALFVAPAIKNLLSQLATGFLRSIHRTRERNRYRRAYLRWLSNSQEEAAIQGGRDIKIRLSEVFVTPMVTGSTPENVVSMEPRTGFIKWATQEIGQIRWHMTLQSFGVVGVSKDGPIFELFQDDRHRFLMRWYNFLVRNKDRLSGSNNTLMDSLARSGRHLLILGKEGTGKTFLLRHLALVHARTQVGAIWERHRARRLCPSIGLLLPVFLSLRQVGPELSKDRSLLDCMLESLPPDLRQACPTDFFPDYAKTGRCLLLLDGLDECADAVEYERAREAIQGFLALHPDNWVVVTARPAGLRKDMGHQFSTLTLGDFTRNQVLSCVSQWCKRLVPDTGINQAQMVARRFVEQLYADSRLVEIAQKPLTLSILLLTFSGELSKGYVPTVPVTRVEVYRQCVETLLAKWDEQRTSFGAPIETGLKRRALAHLAWVLHSRGPHVRGGGIPRGQAIQLLQTATDNDNFDQCAQLLDYLIRRVGLLYEDEGGQVTFSHRTFQEYFAAEHVNTQYGLGPFLRDYETSDPHWMPVAVFLAGMVGDPRPVLNSVCPRSGSKVMYESLSTAAQVLLAARDRFPEPLVEEVVTAGLRVMAGHTVLVNGQTPWPLQRFVLGQLAEGQGDFLPHLYALINQQSGAQAATEIFEKWPKSAKLSVLRALSGRPGVTTSTELAMRYLNDDLPELAEAAVRVLQESGECQINLTGVVSHVATEYLKKDSLAFEKMFPLLLRHRTEDEGFLATLKDNVARYESASYSAFLLGYLTEECEAAFMRLTSRSNDYSRDFFLSAGGFVGGRLDQSILSRLALDAVANPDRYVGWRSSMIKLLAVGISNEVIGPLRGLALHPRTSEAAVTAMVGLGPHILDCETTNVLWEVAQRNVGKRHAKIEKADPECITAASLLAVSPHFPHFSAEELVCEGRMAVTTAFLRDLDVSLHYGHVARLRDLLRRRITDDKYPPVYEWLLTVRLAKSPWVTDPTGESGRILMDYLHDGRFYVNGPAALGWCSLARPPMDKATVERMYKLMADASPFAFPGDTQPQSPQKLAFSALCAESAIRQGEWPLS